MIPPGDSGLDNNMDSDSASHSGRRPSAVIDDEGWQRRRSAMYRRESNFSEYVVYKADQVTNEAETSQG